MKAQLTPALVTVVSAVVNLAGPFLQPTGSAPTTLVQKFHAFTAVENYAFRDYHAIEMPDSYELEFLKWSEENTEENFNFIVKYSLSR